MLFRHHALLVLFAWLWIGTVSCRDGGSDDFTPAAVTTITSTAGGGGSSGGSGGAMTSTGGMGGMAGAGGASGTHDCSVSIAEDLTGQGTVEVTAMGHDWTIGHNRCLRVSAGTTLVWTGDFTLHPLRGGVQPNVDGASPITTDQMDPSADTREVTLSNPGDFPYFCLNHPVTMNGVIYVE